MDGGPYGGSVNLCPWGRIIVNIGGRSARPGLTASGIRAPWTKLWLYREEISVFDSFFFLGSAIGNGGRSFKEVSRRLGIASSVMNSLNRCVWSCQYLCRVTKIRLFRALVLPVLLHRSEAWSIRARERGCLSYFSARSLRRIMGYRWDGNY